MYQYSVSVLSVFPFNAKSPTYACTYEYLPSVCARNLSVTAISFTLASTQPKENNISVTFQAQGSMQRCALFKCLLSCTFPPHTTSVNEEGLRAFSGSDVKHQ